MQYEAKLGKDPGGHPYKKTPLRPASQAAGFKVAAARKQVLSLNARGRSRTSLQARAAAQDAAAVKAFQRKVAHDLSELDRMDAMAERRSTSK